MAVNFTELLENAELTEEVKSALQEAWEGKISEAREELTAESLPFPSQTISLPINAKDFSTNSRTLCIWPVAMTKSSGFSS
mgnify:CR=1 FL=1